MLRISFVLILLILTCVGHDTAMAETLERFDLRSDFSGWKNSNFYSNNCYRVTKDPEGVILTPARKSKEKEKIIATFYKFFPCPSENVRKISFNIRYRAKSGKLPMIFCLSGGCGAGVPAIKHKIIPVTDGKWHEIAILFDLTAYNTMELKHLFFEIIMEGCTDGTEYWQISDITVEPIVPPAVECRFMPYSRNIPAGFGTGNIIAAIRTNVPNQHLRAVLLNKNESDAHIESVEIQLEKPASTSCSFSLANELPGNYRVELYANDKLISSAIFRKFVPKPNSFLVVDGIPYFRGRPFFTIGIYHASDPVIDIVNKFNVKNNLLPLTRYAMMENLRKRGFNTIHHSWKPGTSDFHRAAARSGLLVLNETPRRETKLAYQRIAAILDEPNLMGWVPFDEPQANWANQAAALYDKFRDIDPNHPVCIAFEGGGFGLGRRPLADIAIEDFYPVNSADTNLGITGTFLDTINKNIVAGNPGGCLFLAPQLFRAGTTGCFCFEPTLNQVRANVHIGLVHNAKGIIYYAFFTTETTPDGMSYNPKRKYWYLPESPLWDSIGTLNAELAGISDFILMGTEVPSVRFDMLKEARAWQLEDRLLVIVVNPSGEKTIQGNIFLPEEWNNGQAGKISIKLPPYGVFRKIYQSCNSTSVSPGEKFQTK